MTTDNTALNLTPPPTLILGELIQDTAPTWKQWLRAFEQYAEATNLNTMKPEEQVAVFISVISHEAIVICDIFNLTEAEKNDLRVLKKSFDQYKINKTYEKL